MQQIKIDVGRNIVDTARASGVPSFQAGEVYGRIDYHVANIPEGISAAFVRPGLEVTVASPYSVRLYSDKEYFENLEVYAAVVRVNNEKLNTHQAAHAFMMDLMAQFTRGKWERYFDEGDARLSGRSSYLGADGTIDVLATGSLDSTFAIPFEDWPAMVKQGAYWRWMGDGVRAQLSVSHLGSAPSDKDVPWYVITLEFELLDYALKNEREGEARRLAEGDAKGWDLTGRKKAGLKERAELNKVLEANAIERGDQVLPEQAGQEL